MRPDRAHVAVLTGLVVAASLTVWAAGEDPRLAIHGSDGLVVSNLPAILADDEVKRHLVSGLTTSFVFQVRSPGLPRAGAARIDIRFELWDEVYLVTIVDGRGRVDRTQYDSDESLHEWWSEAGLVLVDTPTESLQAGLQAKVSLAVVPFSQAELVDTQKWLAESIGQAQGGSGAGRPGGASRAVSALIATSMQRRAVRSMSWSLPVERPDGT